MMNIKHSKFKNSGILFELLVRQITSDTLDGKDSKARDILQQFFVKTELGREYKLYETLSKKANLTEIKEISLSYDINKFFKHKLPNYKSQAALYTLIEINSNSKFNNLELEIDNKFTIIEFISKKPDISNPPKSNVLEEYKGYDTDLKTLTYNILLKKFNEKYINLNEDQKIVLKELVTSIDNTPRLKEFYNTKVDEIKTTLTELNTKVTNKTIQIKINEVIKILPLMGKTSKINDEDLINLLQYYDLIKELETSHV